MVVRMRHTRAHTRNRRSHHALKGARLTVSKEEGVVRPRHRALLDGSQYRGRSVMDKESARVARKQKADKARGAVDAPQKEKEATKEVKETKEEVVAVEAPKEKKAPKAKKK